MGFLRAVPRDFLRVKPEGNPKGQPEENPFHPDSAAKKYILFNIGAKLEVGLEYSKQIHSTPTW